MIFAKYLKYRRDIESVILFFLFHKTLKEINETPRMRFTRESFATRQLKLAKRI